MTTSSPAETPAPPRVLLAHHLRQLKLPTVLREYEKVAAEAAREGLDHVRFLLRLVELELIDRERRMVERRIRAARFPAVKSFDTFDFAAIPLLNKPLVLELARCEYVVARDNIIALGNSGTGKTHVCLALGLAACQRGLSVAFATAAGLVHLSTAQTNCAGTRRDSVPVGLREKGREALVCFSSAHIAARIAKRGAMCAAPFQLPVSSPPSSDVFGFAFWL